MSDSSADVLTHALVEVVPNATGPPGYKCKKCNASYERRQMIWHIRTHTGEKPLLCDFSNCEKAFARPGALRDHKKRNHDKVYKHGCPICDKKFFCRSDMLGHIVVHDEARQTRERFLPSQMMKLLSEVDQLNFDGQLIASNCVCGICGKVFDTQGGKRRHIKGVHPDNHQINVKQIKTENIKIEQNGDDLLSCTKCPKKFVSSLALKIHRQVSCDISGNEKEFEIKKENIKKEEIDMIQSKKDIKGDAEFSCGQCEKSLSTREFLDIHLIIHKELNRMPCKEKNCNNVFPSQKSLMIHLEVDHKVEKKTENLMFYSCEECDKQCTSKGHLKDHMIKHSKERNFVCMDCGKKLKRRSTLADHMKIHTGEKNYHCDKCEEKFITSAGLRNHTLTRHTDLSSAVPFMCSYCGREFKKKDYLLKHVTEHTGEKNFECNICPKKFRFATSLENHLNMHNGIKRFQCPHCEKRFTQRQQRTMHVRRHTGDKRHKCNSCEMAFIEPAGLRNHMKRHQI